MASKPKKRKINGENPVETEEIQSFLSYFFYKKIPLSRRVGYAMDGSMDE